MQELWLLENLKSWHQNPHVLYSLVVGSRQPRHCVKWRTPSNALISTTIPYISWLLLGRWFISPLLLPLVVFFSLHQRHFRPSKSSLSVVHYWRSDSSSTTVQFTKYWVLLWSLLISVPNWCMSYWLVLNQLVYLDFGPQTGVINKIYNLLHHHHVLG